MDAGTFLFSSKPLETFNICGIQLNVINMLPYKKPPVPGILTSQPSSP